MSIPINCGPQRERKNTANKSTNVHKMYFIVNAVNLWAFVDHTNVLGQTVPNRTLVKCFDRISYPENLGGLTKKYRSFELYSEIN